MYTYVRRPGCKKENTATYVHTGGVSNAYLRICTARACVHGWAEWRNYVIVMFMGSQLAGSERNASSCSSGELARNSRWKRGMAYRRTEETALCSVGHVRNGILFIRRGLAYRKTEETDLLRLKRGPVDREGCGIPQNGGNRLVLERYSRNGGPVHQEGCGVPQNGTPQDTVHLHR